MSDTCDNRTQRVLKILNRLRESDSSISAVENIEDFPQWMEDNLFINSKDYGKIPLRFDDIPGSPVSFGWQRELVHEFFIDYRAQRYNLVKLKARQCGSTTLWLAVVLTLAHHIPGFHVRIVYQDEKTAIGQKREKWDFIYNNIPAGNRRNTVINNETQVMFDNGSMVFFDHVLPAHKILEGAYRSFTCRFILVTEAGFFVMGKEFWEAIRSSLSTNGCIVIESTPKYHGWFRNMYTRARDGKMPGWKALFLGRKQLYGTKEGQALIDRYIAENGEEAARREYAENDRDCWLSAGGYIFDVEACEDMLTETFNLVIPRYTINVRERCLEEDSFGDLFLLEGPIKGDYRPTGPTGAPRSQDGRYIIAADVCAGTEKDYHIAYIGNYDTREIVGEFANNVISPTQFADRLYLLGMWFNWALLMTEANGEWGKEVIDRLREIRYPNLYIQFQSAENRAKKPMKKWGWYTDKSSRPIIIGRLGEKIRTRTLKMPFKDFWQETLTFIDNEGRPEAQEGFHDDRVMAACILNFGFETYIWRLPKGEKEVELGPHDSLYYLKNKPGVKVS